MAKTMNLTDGTGVENFTVYRCVWVFKITTHDWFVRGYVCLYGSHVIWFPFRHPPLDVTSVCLLRKVEEKDILAQHGKTTKVVYVGVVRSMLWIEAYLVASGLPR